MSVQLELTAPGLLAEIEARKISVDYYEGRGQWGASQMLPQVCGCNLIAWAFGPTIRDAVEALFLEAGGLSCSCGGRGADEEPG